MDGRGPIAWIIVGALAGYVARLFVRGEQVSGCVMTIVLGVAGSFVGGTLANLLFGERWDIDAAGIIGSIVGAIIVLLIVRATGRRTRY